MDSHMKQVWAVIGALYIALAILFVKEVVHEYNTSRDASHQAQGDNESVDLKAVELELTKSDVQAQWVMAYGTIILFVLTLATLIFSIVTTNKNLALTQKNIDAYVANERGRLMFDRCEPDDGKISTCFKNVGRSYVIIKEVSLIYSHYRVADPIVRGTFDDLTDLVEKEAVAAYGGSEARSAYPLQLGDALTSMNGDNNVPIVVEFSVTYEAPPAGHFRFYGSLVINFSFPAPHLVHRWWPHHEVPTKWEMSAQAKEEEKAREELRKMGVGL